MSFGSWWSRLLVLSFGPLLWITTRHSDWLAWVVPLLLAFLIDRWWHRPAWTAAPPIAPPEPGHGQAELPWQAALVSLPNAVLLLDGEWSLLWHNPAARDLLGIETERDQGQPVLQRLGESSLDDYLRHGDFSQAIEVHSPVDGRALLAMRFTPLSGECRWMVVIQDITDQCQLDRLHRDFLVNVSHELKTPITVFRGLLETLPDLPRDAPQWQRALQLLQQQTLRMQGLIETQTALLRIGSAHYHYPSEPIAMEAFLREMVEEAEVLSGSKGHQFTLQVDQGLNLEVNRELLRCIVGNLLANAVHHTADLTAVQIQWQRDRNGRPTLSLTDNGGGIAAYHLPRLTEKYYRVTQNHPSLNNGPPYQGSGMGLALVKQALDRCQATLSIHSHPGKGSTFSCRFPATL